MEPGQTRVVFMGTPEFAVPSLEALARGGYDVVGVLTQPDRPAGRGRHMEASPVKRSALKHGLAHALAVQQPRTLRTAEAQDALAALRPDVIVVAAYGPDPAARVVLDLPRFGCVNVHGSLLPRHRGAAPIAAAILAGDAETGDLDHAHGRGRGHGPVLDMATLPIAPDDTTASLTVKLAQLGADTLMSTLSRWLEGEIAPRPQSETGATYAPRID